MSAPIIETNRLILRRPVVEDEPFCAEFMMSERAKGIGGPYGRGRAWRGFASMFGHWEMRGFGVFVLEEKASRQPVGWCGPFFPGEYKEVELAWSVWSAEHEGKGFAYEAALAARDYAYGELGLETLVSFVDPENERSAALAKRLGAVLDPDAFDPYFEIYGPALVFRHPSPAELEADGSVEAYA